LFDHAIAELGSDPNSGHSLSTCQRRFTDLGSDPNSAGRDSARVKVV
jgi:hypothetical protein